MQTLMRLDGKVCLVTGSGSQSGIGFAAAAIIGRLGGRLAIAATTEQIYQRAEELGAEGIEATGYIADLMDRRQVLALADFKWPTPAPTQAGRSSLSSPPRRCCGWRCLPDGPR
ncbi:hypothetical protein [Brevibacillus massiliensis]|uniref:hypothetical protein n=1 Tax=Brevibacillus massiliensis TaxID=1118054 RepID=UPI0011C959B4|nr:hypothetical protein [Brevibacillus massiliensis]